MAGTKETDTARFCKLFGVKRIIPGRCKRMGAIDDVWTRFYRNDRVGCAISYYQERRCALIKEFGDTNPYSPEHPCPIDDHEMYAYAHGGSTAILTWSPYCSIKELQHNVYLHALADAMHACFGYSCFLSTLNLYHGDHCLCESNGIPWGTIIWYEARGGDFYKPFDPENVIQ